MCKRKLVMSHISKLELSHQAIFKFDDGAIKHGTICYERERTAAHQNH